MDTDTIVFNETFTNSDQSPMNSMKMVESLISEETVMDTSVSSPAPVPAVTNGNHVDVKQKLGSDVFTALLHICRQYNFKETEEAFMKEVNANSVVTTAGEESEMNKILSAYKSDGSPDIYYNVYGDLMKFVDNSLDVYKYELGTILYPMFVHIYLELVYNGHGQQAAKFMKTYGPKLEDYYQESISKISTITSIEQMVNNEFIQTFRSNQYNIRMSTETHSILKRHLNEKDKTVLLKIFKSHLNLDLYEGMARNQAQIEAISGGMIGESRREDNKSKVYYGLLKEPDLQSFFQVDDDDDMDGGDGDRPKKKKMKKDIYSTKRAKNDPNAPPVDRMPLPELKDTEKMEKAKALRESTKRITLGPDVLPSCCCYTLMNTYLSVSCVEISEDATMLAVGFSDSRIRVWSLIPQKLKCMKQGEQLQAVDCTLGTADDVLHRLMDDRSAETTKTLLGHSDAVYRTSFSADKTLLLSCSEDGTVRLWSLFTWTCLVVYKGHLSPVWDCEFSPHGYYFASCGQDKTARLWVTDNHQPIRIFAGHYADVDCVKFHPNSNYIATGSSDRTIRLWDCVSGTQVRLLTGHKGSIYTLCFSTDGRYLASGGADKNVLLWDISQAHLIANFTGHTDRIETLTFSREGNILVSGGQDCAVKLWDYAKLIEGLSFEEGNSSHNPELKQNNNDFLIRTLRTKESPVMHVFFTRRNVLFTISVLKAADK